MLKHKLFWIFVFLVCTVTTYATNPTPLKPLTISPLKNDPIKLGVIYNLTGAMNVFDQYSLNGAKLAVNEINAKGGIYGRPLKLEIVDGKTNVVHITKSAKKIAAATNIADIIIGLNDTDMAIAAIPSITAAKKLFITSGATSPKISALYSQHVFLACFSDNNQATAAAAFAYQRLNAKNIMLVTQKDMEYALLLTQYFRSSFSQLNGSIVGYASFSIDKPSIAKDLAKLKLQKITPDAFYLSTGSVAAIKIIQEIRSAGFKQPIIGGDGLETRELLAQTVPDFDNIYYTAHAFITKDNSDSNVKSFIENYKETFNQEPDNSFAALGYDTINLVAKAIETAKSTNADKVREALLSIHNFKGLTGDISYVNDNTIPLKTVNIIKLQNGIQTLAEKWP